MIILSKTTLWSIFHEQKAINIVLTLPFSTTNITISQKNLILRIFGKCDAPCENQVYRHHMCACNETDRANTTITRRSTLIFERKECVFCRIYLAVDKTCASVRFRNSSFIAAVRGHSRSSASSAIVEGFPFCCQ